MKSTSFSILSLSLLPALVSAHGFLSAMTIDGKNFKGNVPNGATNPSGLRQVADIVPIKGANNPDVNCGIKAQPASLSLDAMPGSQLTFDWRGGDGSKWPHNIGPMFTYMASCGSTTCDKFDAEKAKWFKIQEVGRKTDGSGQWFQQDLFNGGVAPAQIPPTLAPGNYLIRHEIMGLHLATSMGGAEFYAGCAQLKVGGSQTGTPASNELVSLPGAYKDSDPGIFDPSVFDTKAPYTFPGPVVTHLADSNSTTPSTNPPKPPKSSGSGASSGSKSGGCKLKPKPKAAKNGTVAATESSYRPRHVSRVMRDLRTSFH